MIHLAEKVISAKNVKTFENRLDKLWEDHQMKYNFTQTINGTGRRQIINRMEKVEPNIEEQADVLENT